MRLSGTKANSTNQYRGLGEQLYDLGGARPTLDLNFANNESLVDSVTGKNLVTHTRASSATYVDGDGVIRNATTNLLLQSEDFSTTWITSSSSVTSNEVISPNGTLTADKVTVSSSGLSVRQSVSGSFAASSTYTASVYIKAEGVNVGKVVKIGLRRADSTALQQDYNEVTLTGDWQRVSKAITWTLARTIISFDIRTDFTSGTAATEFFVWGAQLEESSTATPYVKSDVTWTSRASNATYYDYTGTLRKSSYNLLHYSEEFDNSYYPDIRCTVTPNATLAPNGTLTADAIVEDTSPGSHILQADGGFNPTSGTTYTYSWHLKAGERTDLRIEFGFDNGVWQGETLDINLNNGTVSNVTGFTNTPVVDNLGNGWYRLSATVTAQASGNGVVRMTPKVGGTITYTGDGSSKYFIWGAQLETGTYAGDYAKTTSAAASTARNVAFLPDGNGNFVSAGELLLEDAGTNLVTYSEEFDNAFYFISTRLTVDPNTATAPNNTLTADKLIGTSNNDTKYARFIANVVSGYQYALSFYAKKDEYEVLQLQATNQNFAGTLIYANFDLASGTVVSFADCSPTIESIGNGWYRCVLILPAATSSGSNAFRFAPYASGDPERLSSYTGDGTSGLYVWGAQLEESSYPTSYIPTSGATATRAADVSSSSSNTFGNSFYDQTKGTTFTDAFKKYAVPSGKFPTVSGFNDGTNANRILNTWVTNTQVGFTVTKNGLATASLYAVVTASRRRLANAFATNSFASAVNGSTPLIDNFGALPTVPSMRIGDQFGIHTLNGAISRITYWPTRLSNDTLQTITK